MIYAISEKLMLNKSEKKETKNNMNTNFTYQQIFVTV